MSKRIPVLGLEREEWLKLRKQGIGGSDAGAICGLNPFVSPMRIYLDKTTEGVQENDTESMRQGRDLEEYVAKRFTEATGKKARRTNFIHVSDEYPFMIANVDRMVVGENAGLECKTASAYNADKWRNGELPAHYYIQCLHYMAVTGAERWYLAVVILGKEFKYVRIDRDENAISDLVEIERKFWENHVLAHVLPTPDGTDSSESVLKEYYRNARQGKQIRLTGFDEQLLRHEELDALINKLMKEKKEIEQEIQMEMKDAESAVADRFYIRWSQVDQERFDSARLKAEDPKLYEKYLKTNSYRRFMIKAA